MRYKKTHLVAVMSCFMMFAAAPLLPAQLSPLTAAYAKGGGGGHGGNGGSGSGGHAGEGSAHAGVGAAHSDTDAGKGLALGQESDHTGRAVRDHGVSGQHTGRAHGTTRGHGLATSSVAQSRTTRGVTKATAVAATKPVDHDAQGKSPAGAATSK